jgi:alkylation response protein AidB-like acyl-CoA dehydrogenase
VREKARPWIDSGQERASDDPYTIQAIGDLTIRQHAAEALLDRAGLILDAAVARPDAENVAAAQLATEVALAATNKLFELSGTRSTLAAENLDRHWRNARTHTLHDPVRWKYAIIGNHALNGVNPPLHAWS